MTSPVLGRARSWAGEAAWGGLGMGLRPLQAMMGSPTALFLVALTAMLLRHPDVPFYEIDRVAFSLLVAGVAVRAVVTRDRLLVVKRATWPMIGLTLLAVASVIAQPFDNETWCLLAAKFIVPFALFHLAGLVFREERRLRQFEMFSLVVLAYLCFTAIAFLVGAKSLIFPRFILDESLGYHVDRARGPLLQAVANGVSLNMLGVLALHAFLRRRIRGLSAAVLLGSLPVAILATMTRAVWLSFAVSVMVLIFRAHNRRLRLICVGVAMVGTLGLLIALSFDDQRRALTERLKESGPLDFRRAVYTAGWEMFLEKPLTGWGINQMPAELARHVSGYKEKELYPHNTYLELLVEHGVFGLALYVWLMWELWRLGRGQVPRAERGGFLSRQFLAMWPVMLGIYWVNAALVVMNYQFVNGLLFSMAGIYRAGYGAETSYVPNGGVLREWRVPDKIFDWGLEPGRYILFLGRFSPEKGCHLLVEAYEKLETDVKLVMAGGSSYCDNYSRELQTHAGPRIKMLDWVSGEALDELLTNAMMFVLPSDLEGLSLALLDAMGAGLCVVSSDVAENREAVEDAGFTFRRGDAADLADRLRFLIANPAVREAAGQAAKRRIREHYQWPQVAREIERVYFEMMGWELAETGARRPVGRAAAAAPTGQRRVG